MMHKPWQISRRTALKGFGTAVALPLLDAMLPATAYTAFGRAAQAAEAAKKTPNRMAFLYVPNGIHMPDWTPEKVGADFELPPTLKLLEKFKQDFLVLSGLAQDGARAHGDGGGDHARAMASFLTGCHPRKTHGADIKAGVSADQVAAQRIGQLTRFSSLELGCEAGAQNGNCDSGYSCAYSANSSWKTESTPLAKEVNPRLVFERLFSDGHRGESKQAAPARDIRPARACSILPWKTPGNSSSGSAPPISASWTSTWSPSANWNSGSIAPSRFRAKGCRTSPSRPACPRITANTFA